MIARLLSTLGLATVRNELAARARRARRQAILIAFAILFLLIAIGYGLATLTAWLAGLLGPIAAYGIIAGVFAFLALIVMLISAAGSGRERPAPPRPRPEPAAAEADDNVLGSLAAIVIAGYMLGRYFTRRR